MQDPPKRIETIKEYYGSVLKSSRDLKTNACCTARDSLSPAVKSVMGLIDDEIITTYYGCGSPIPPALEGSFVLDLGCGTGRDVYITSSLVGPHGFVTGIDMTDHPLQVAKRHIPSQMKRFGYTRENVAFKKGYIGDLKEVGIQDNSLDVVISNCVINLSPDKKAVFSEIFRVLKPGGELIFSDIFSGRRIPKHLRDDPVLLGECLAGAMYIEDFRRTLREIGFLDYRIVNQSKVFLQNPDIERAIGMVDFYSMTIRIFKLAALEDLCEDYGQVATYLGTIQGYSHAFELDSRHRFITGKPALVSGNTASMLQETRFAKHFKVTGDRTTHFGPFHYGDLSSFQKDDSEESPSGTCC